ncbi:MAG: DNA polymerase IV [Acidimicrobiales bacterium]
MTDGAVRTILHVDMDAFFVSVELLDRPELRGRPVIVGGSGGRGVVAAASYEARAYGVHSAMPSVQAQRCCPHAVFLDGRYDRYAEVSERVMAIFRSTTPLVEPLSLDEAFLDVTGAQRLHGDGPTIAAELRRRVLAEEGLTCSVGVAPTKFLAKLASEAAKPKASRDGPVFGRGVHVVEVGGELAFLHPLPVQALWGVGPATLARLQRLGIVTVGDLAALPADVVVAAIGRAAGNHLHALACGRDDREVVTDRAPKSIGHEETFAHDLHRPEALERELVRLADGVADRLRRHDLVGRTITLKLRYADFQTLTRSTTLDVATASAAVIGREAKALLGRIDVAAGVRLLGVSVSGLAEAGEPRQLRLDDLFASDGDAAAGAADRAGPGARSPADADWEEAEAAVDAIRARFGTGAIGPATLVGEGGLRRKRRGEQQWGPSAPAPDAEPSPPGGSAGSG